MTAPVKLDHIFMVEGEKQKKRNKKRKKKTEEKKKKTKEKR